MAHLKRILSNIRFSYGYYSQSEMPYLDIIRFDLSICMTVVLNIHAQWSEFD